MITRKQYLSGEFSHDEYYSQFIDESTRNYLLKTIPLTVIKKSVDENMNDIPLALWDSIPVSSEVAKKLREAGDYLTIAGAVCIYKAQARKLKNEKI